MESDSIAHHGRCKYIPNFPIDKRKDAAPSIHDMHLCVECGKDAGVLTSDRPGADDRQRFRQAIQFENGIGIIYSGSVERKDTGTSGRRTCGDKDVSATYPLRHMFRVSGAIPGCSGRLDQDGVRIFEDSGRRYRRRRRSSQAVVKASKSCWPSPLLHAAGSQLRWHLF
jgi:hypothetical protein